MLERAWVYIIMMKKMVLIYIFKSADLNNKQNLTDLNQVTETESTQIWEYNIDRALF